MIYFSEPPLTRNEERTVRFDVRDSDGSKTSLVEESLEPGEVVQYRAKRSGYASVHRCTRPASLDYHPQAWQLASMCEVVHVKVGDGQDTHQLGDRLLSTKIGLPLELRPYLSTATLVPGDALPVRVYQKGVPMPGRDLEAIGPGGQAQRVVTNHKGVGEIRIDALGQWRVQAQLEDPELPSGVGVARLVFEVQAPTRMKEGN